MVALVWKKLLWAFMPFHRSLPPVESPVENIFGRQLLFILFHAPMPRPLYDSKHCLCLYDSKHCFSLVLRWNTPKQYRRLLIDRRLRKQPVLRIADVAALLAMCVSTPLYDSKHCLCLCDSKHCLCLVQHPEKVPPLVKRRLRRSQAVL
jgi:hypothetical protein